MRARETSESESSESESMYDFRPHRRALESHTNESHTTVGVERKLERGCDRKEHVCVSNYGEKSWPPRFAREFFKVDTACCTLREFEHTTSKK